MIVRCSFVSLTTPDLARARAFWVDGFGFPVLEEKSGRFCIVDAGGLRLCLDRPDGAAAVSAGSDPAIGLKVASVDDTVATLAARGIAPSEGPAAGQRGRYAVVKDPEGRSVILTEVD